MDQSTLKTPGDAGKGPEGLVKRWKLEWRLAEKRERDWVKAGRKVVSQYRNEDEASKKVGSFNILWSNTETLRPSLYNQTPKPDVRRRYRDTDPVGKEIAEVLERALVFSVDAGDLDGVMSDVVDDYLLPGRAVARVRYNPIFGDEVTPEPRFPEEGEQSEFVGEDGVIREDTFTPKVYEEVTSEHWDWQCFQRGPGRKWEEVRWVGFEHRLTQDEGKKEFGDAWKGVDLDFKTDDDDEPDVFKRGVVWEIWSKDDLEVYWIAPSKKEGPLRIEKDPLGLDGFFPVPKPLYSVKTTDTLVPVEEYRLYKSQAEELDRLTKRIRNIISGVKLRGGYDATIKEISRITEGDDNELIPLKDALPAMQQAGGLDKAIWMWPVQAAAEVLVQLYSQREQVKQTIFEITGLSDILRGASDPRETLGAQQIKAQTGSLRLQRKQRDVQRFARDLIRMKGEIIAEHFSPETLKLMTGKDVTDEMIKVMRDDGQRGFRVDIETDSTIAADQATDQQNVTELFTAITGFIGAAGPAVVQGFMPIESAKALLMAGVRRFKLGREVEDALEQIGGQEGEQGQQAEPGQQEQQPDPQAQMEQAKAQSEAEDLQREAQIDKAKHELEIEELNRKRERDELAHQVAMAELNQRQVRAA